MDKIRNSVISRILCFFMVITITTMSCEQSGHLISSSIIENKIDEQISQSGFASNPEELVKMKDLARALIGDVLNKADNGQIATEEDALQFLLDYSLKKGYLSNITSELRIEMMQFVKNTRYVSANDSYAQYISVCKDKGYYSENVAKFLGDFEQKMYMAKSRGEATQILSETEILLKSNTSFSDKERFAIGMGLKNGKDLLAISDDSQFLSGANLKENCVVECISQSSWVWRIVTSVLAVALFLLLIFPPLGLAALLATVIAVGAWVLAWVIKCAIFCANYVEPLCPPGQTATCQGSFVLDAAGRRCINPNLPADAFIFGGCVMSPRPSNGQCLSGSTPQGSNCLWECFFPEPANFGKDSKGILGFDPVCK